MNPLAITYLNRLSDLLFILARHANREQGDVLWVPGGRALEVAGLWMGPGRYGCLTSERTFGGSCRHCAAATFPVT